MTFAFSYVPKPTVWGLFGLKVLGFPVPLHVAFVERAAWVQEHAHVVVCVVFEPDADAGGPVESEVFPGPPQRFHPRDNFRMEVPLGAPFSCAAVDVADVGGQQLFVQELFG